MRNDFQNNRCIAEIGSVTEAMWAQSLLAKEAILCEVIQGDSSQRKRGCVYAVLYDCRQERDLKNILKRAGIRVHSFYGARR